MGARPFVPFLIRVGHRFFRRYRTRGALARGGHLLHERLHSFLPGASLVQRPGRFLDGRALYRHPMYAWKFSFMTERLPASA